MDQIYLKALGNLLMNYHSDLTYISNFKLFIKGRIDQEQYMFKTKGSFYSFLIEYRVTRNIQKEEQSNILKHVKEWCVNKNCMDVDGLAELLNKKGITQESKIMTSLSSKILFLNNPIRVLPMDNLAKKALDYKQNDYSGFSKKVDDFIHRNKKIIYAFLRRYEKELIAVESDFDGIKNLDKIRFNRFVDKLLWTKGKEKVYDTI